MNRIRITKTREEIEGTQVDIIFYGRFCVLSDNDKQAIHERIKKGERSGQMGTEQLGRYYKIWAKWNIPFDKINIGDVVKFSTTRKYNPGFTSTKTYTGIVERITWRKEYCVKTDEGMAIVPLKHIERIIK